MRARRVIVVAVILVASVSLVPAAPAESLQACAQRVIRDWYSGGRVDKVYPLRCYRAAIDALPADVLQYSDADRDIARALAYARRGRKDPGDNKPSTTAPTPAPKVARTSPPPSPAPRTARDAATETAATSPGTGPLRLAGGPEPAPVDGSVPYPILGLALLAGILLVSGTAGWILRRH